MKEKDLIKRAISKKLDDYEIHEYKILIASGLKVALIKIDGMLTDVDINHLMDNGLEIFKIDIDILDNRFYYSELRIDLEKCKLL